MSDFDLALRSRRVVTDGAERPAAVCVANGRIAEIRGYGERIDAHIDTDLGELALLPGLVDTHVHVNEPGRTEWEGFATATRAAAEGGVTTLIDMPLNSLPPTVDAAALETKRKAAQGKCAIDVGFWGGAIPGNRAELRGLHEAGVFGFKCFTSPSGVDEFPPLTPKELPGVAEEIAALGSMLLVHAEDPAELSGDGALGHDYAPFLASRPPRAEESAIGQVLAATEPFGTRLHVLHLSAASALRQLADARAAGRPVTVETCPHYLTLAAEDVPDSDTAFKCCPPIRERANAERLWRGLADGVLDCVVSDHSPCPAEMKRAGDGDFGLAWGGVSSLQLGLPVVWTEASRRGHSLSDVVRWMSTRTADLVGLVHKGRIEPGARADLVAFDPDTRTVVDPAALRHRHPVTPYAGARLRGRVVRTWLGGAVIAGDGVEPAAPRGTLLRGGSG